MTPDGPEPISLTVALIVAGIGLIAFVYIVVRLSMEYREKDSRESDVETAEGETSESGVEYD